MVGTGRIVPGTGGRRRGSVGEQSGRVWGMQGRVGKVRGEERLEETGMGRGRDTEGRCRRRERTGRVPEWREI